MVTLDETTILAFLQRHLESGECNLKEREMALCKRVFTPPFTRYADRLASLGFTGHGRVLDACCGFGQWSLCLAELNDRVDACDADPNRIDIISGLAGHLDIRNLEARACPLQSLDYDDNTFDAAFCYVALNCTPWKESLGELYRVLKPGGKLYFTANGLGYFLRQWVEEPYKTAHRSPRFFTALSLQNTLDYEESGKAPELGQIVTEKDEMRECLHDLGFTIHALEDEGHIDMSGGAHPPTPFFPGTYHGLTCCYEALVVK